jgi:hypothetical protein
METEGREKTPGVDSWENKCTVRLNPLRVTKANHYLSPKTLIGFKKPPRVAEKPFIKLLLPIPDWCLTDDI